MSADFDRVAFDLEYGDPSGFHALYRQAEQQLHRDHPGGFDVTDIGRTAWGHLPIEDYPKALRSLFYCYWVVDRQEQEEDRLREAALAGGQGWPPERDVLGTVRDALSMGPNDDGDATVDYAALHALADEFVVLRERLALLRGALTGDRS